MTTVDFLACSAESCATRNPTTVISSETPSAASRTSAENSPDSGASNVTMPSL